MPLALKENESHVIIEGTDAIIQMKICPKAMRYQTTPLFEEMINPQLRKQFPDFNHFFGTWYHVGWVTESFPHGDKRSARVFQHRDGNSFFTDSALKLIEVVTGSWNLKTDLIEEVKHHIIPGYDIDIHYPALNPFTKKVNQVFISEIMKHDFMIRFDGVTSTKLACVSVSKMLMMQFDWFVEIMQPDGPTLRNFITAKCNRSVCNEALSAYLDVVAGKSVDLHDKYVEDFNAVCKALNPESTKNSVEPFTMPGLVKNTLICEATFTKQGRGYWRDGKNIKLPDIYEGSIGHEFMKYLNGISEWAYKQEDPEKEFMAHWLHEDCKAWKSMIRSLEKYPIMLTSLIKLNFVPSKEIMTQANMNLHKLESNFFDPAQ